jgi:tRNA(Ile)-lysidine synthase
VSSALDRLADIEAPLLVACSGGPDSLATLIAVARSRPGRVTAAWFDHATRPAVEVTAEGEVVRQAARNLGVGFVEGRASRPPRGEAAARTARYRWLARAATRAGVAAAVTGHTRDDQAETVLLRLARGTGARGAAGMASDSPWPVAGPGPASLRLLRPLLSLGRADVEAYLEALDVRAVRDPSNESREYARNRIRHDVLPRLAEVNSEAAAHLAAFAGRQREDDDALAGWAERWLAEQARPAGGGLVLPRASLVALPRAVRSRVAACAAERAGFRLSEAQQTAIGRHLEQGGVWQVAAVDGTVEGRGTVVRMRRNA